MQQLKVAAPYLRLFFWCGQTSYMPRTDKLDQHVPGFGHGRSPTLYSKLPTILWTLGTCIVNGVLVYLVNFGPTRTVYDNSDAIITNIFITCQLLKTLAVFVQGFFYHGAISDATQILLGLEQFFIGNLHYQINYRRFAKEMLFKTLFIAVMYLQSAILLGLRFVRMDFVEPIATIIKVLQMKSVTILLQMIFYVDLMRFHMVELNAVIERDAYGEQDTVQNKIIVVYRKSTKEIVMSNKYKNYKHLHYRLWNAVQQINHYFGWCLTAVFLQTFIDCVYNSYWQYNALSQHLHLVEVIHPASDFISILVPTICLANACYYLVEEKNTLAKNLEKFMFWSNDYDTLFNAKQEILMQMSELPINIVARGFFDVDRQLIAGLAAASCTYLIIFIQFDLAVK